MIAAQLYTVRDRLRDERSLREALTRLKTVGYDAVELAGIEAVPAPKIAKTLADTGMEACSMHVYWDRLTTSTDAVAEECQLLGCEATVVVAMPPEYRDPAGYQRFAHELLEVASRLEPHGISLAYHNHSFEFERCGLSTGLELLIRETRTGNVQIQLDTYWAQYGGASPASWIRRFSDRVTSVHLKDMTVEGGEPAMAELGAGNLDWNEILSACREADIRWLIVEQDVCRNDPYESLATSLSYLTGAFRRRHTAVSTG